MTRLILPLALSLLTAAAQQPAADPDFHEETLLRLTEVKRVYVEKLSGGDTAEQMRDMIISSLLNARIFLITENPERADAFLRGSAEDLVFTDVFEDREGIAGRASVRAGSGVRTNRDFFGAAAGVGQNEGTRIAERKHEASAAVRLVNKDGDVIWSTTKESLGGKFRGASADVADKITRQLAEDYARARRLRAAPPAPSQ